MKRKLRGTVSVCSVLLLIATGIPAFAGDSTPAPASAAVQPVAPAFPFPAGRLYVALDPLFAPPLSFGGPDQQQTNQPSTSGGHGWARRHLLLFSGLALTGAGAGLVAGGGAGQVSGCFASGPYGAVQCTTATTWGASGRHIGGFVLICVGVPIAILGIFKHP